VSTNAVFCEALMRLARPGMWPLCSDAARILREHNHAQQKEGAAPFSQSTPHEKLCCCNPTYIHNNACQTQPITRSAKQ
jgi:hypothetical protein